MLEKYKHCLGRRFCYWMICILLQTYFLPVIGLVEPEDLKPADLVVSAKRSFLVESLLQIVQLSVLKWFVALFY